MLSWLAYTASWAIVAIPLDSGGGGGKIRKNELGLEKIYGYSKSGAIISQYKIALVCIVTWFGSVR